MWRKLSWPNLQWYPGIHVEELTKTTKNLNQDNWAPERNLKKGPPEYESGVLTTRPRRSMYYSVGLWEWQICYCLIPQLRNTISCLNNDSVKNYDAVMNDVADMISCLFVRRLFHTTTTILENKQGKVQTNLLNCSAQSYPRLIWAYRRHRSKSSWRRIMVYGMRCSYALCQNMWDAAWSMDPVGGILRLSPHRFEYSDLVKHDSNARLPPGWIITWWAITDYATSHTGYEDLCFLGSSHFMFFFYFCIFFVKSCSKIFCEV
jgi:hypothetical protein